jgi:hypothetical protein
MQSAAAACICNLAANLNSKEIIATSGALQVCSKAAWKRFLLRDAGARRMTIGVSVLMHVRKIGRKIYLISPILPQVLVEVLQSENQAAAAQAAGALWSLCVDNDANKQAAHPPSLGHSRVGAVECHVVCTSAHLQTCRP